MFRDVFSVGVLKKARDIGLIDVKVHNLRDFTEDKHRQVDDRPFGGDPGMVLKPDPLFRAVETIKAGPGTPVVLLSPQGQKFDSRLAEVWARSPQIILICGRYEGVDERVNEFLATDEISVGDYVLTGGELPAMLIVDAVSRFVPRVVGNEESVRSDSFCGGLLGHPQYTRPRDFRGMKVPEILFSGDHKKIDAWRRRMAHEKTRRLRPDLLRNPAVDSPNNERSYKKRSAGKGKNHEHD